jgi:hypothetical protein
MPPGPHQQSSTGRRPAISPGEAPCSDRNQETLPAGSTTVNPPVRQLLHVTSLMVGVFAAVLSGCARHQVAPAPAADVPHPTNPTPSAAAAPSLQELLQTPAGRAQLTVSTPAGPLPSAERPWAITGTFDPKGRYLDYDNFNRLYRGLPLGAAQIVGSFLLIHGDGHLQAFRISDGSQAWSIPDVLPSLGLSFPQQSDGSPLMMVEKRSSADQAGVVDGDILKSINGHALDSQPDAVDAYTSTLVPNAPCNLQLLRQGKPLQLEVTVGISRLEPIAHEGNLILLTAGTGLEHPLLVIDSATGLPLSCLSKFPSQIRTQGRHRPQLLHGDLALVDVAGDLAAIGLKDVPGNPAGSIRWQLAHLGSMVATCIPLSDRLLWVPESDWEGGLVLDATTGVTVCSISTPHGIRLDATDLPGWSHLTQAANSLFLLDYRPMLHGMDLLIPYPTGSVQCIDWTTGSTRWVAQDMPFSPNRFFTDPRLSRCADQIYQDGKDFTRLESNGKRTAMEPPWTRAGILSVAKDRLMVMAKDEDEDAYAVAALEGATGEICWKELLPAWTLAGLIQVDGESQNKAVFTVTDQQGRSWCLRLDARGALTSVAPLERDEQLLPIADGIVACSPKRLRVLTWTYSEPGPALHAPRVRLSEDLAASAKACLPLLNWTTNADGSDFALAYAGRSWLVFRRHPPQLGSLIVHLAEPGGFLDVRGTKLTFEESGSVHFDPGATSQKLEGSTMVPGASGVVVARIDVLSVGALQVLATTTEEEKTAQVPSWITAAWQMVTPESAPGGVDSRPAAPLSAPMKDPSP